MYICSPVLHTCLHTHKHKSRGPTHGFLHRTLKSKLKKESIDFINNNKNNNNNNKGSLHYCAVALSLFQWPRIVLNYHIYLFITIISGTVNLPNKLVMMSRPVTINTHQSFC